MRLVPLAYLASHLLSLLGNSIAGVALPLIVLQATGSPLGAGAVAAATVVPAVVAGLVMGVVIDRINRRTSSVVTDLVSAASVAALPVVDAVSGLSLGWFVLFGMIGSLGDVPGLTAREALLPAVVRHGGVPPERLTGLRESLGAVALLLGPAAAGTLMVFFEGATVLWITAGTSVAAAAITLLIPHRVGRIVAADGAPPRTPTGSVRGQLAAGWRALLGDRFLLAVTVLGVVSLFVLGAMQGLVLPVYLIHVGRPELLGFVITALALGMLLGAGGYAAVGPRGSRRAWFLVGLAGTTVGFALVAGLHSPRVVLFGAFLIGAFSGLANSLLGVLMIERIPDHLRGRILATQNAAMTAAPPAGILLTALLAEHAGVGVAAFAVTAVWTVAAVLTLRARSLHNLEPADTSAEEVVGRAQ
ncbi:MFS transporter [Micromonospora sp. NPDC023956]|uniref:MFS transporter n=1 Tax=Micromonospora sp. NPDC023956 TaxID=3155722 RepID=UPI0033D5D346